MPDAEPGEIYAKRCKPVDVPTYPRVLEHTDHSVRPGLARRDATAWLLIVPLPQMNRGWNQTNAGKLYATTQGDSYRPAGDPLYKSYYMEQRPGLRSAAMAAAMRAEAAALPEAPPPPRLFETTTGAAHGPKDLSGVVVGRRTMRTLDGAPIPLEGRDITFLHEEGIVPAADARRWGGGPPQPHTLAKGGLGADNPISIYSEAAENGTLQSTQFFGTQPGAAAGTFGRSCDFSKPVYDNTKQSEDWDRRDWPPVLMAGTLGGPELKTGDSFSGANALGSTI